MDGTAVAMASRWQASMEVRTMEVGRRLAGKQAGKNAGMEAKRHGYKLELMEGR